MSYTTPRFLCIISIIIAVFFIFGVHTADAETSSSARQQELAAIASQLASLQALIDSLAKTFFSSPSAVEAQSGDSCSSTPYYCTSEVDCTSSGYYWCSNECYGSPCSGTESSSACDYDGICESGESSGSCPGDCGSYDSTGSCPSGFHYHSESGGFCINDQEDYSGTCYDSAGVNTITCPSSTYGAVCTYTTQATCTADSACAWDANSSYCYSSGTYTSGGGSCPSGYHYHSESGGFCMNDQENYSGTCYDSAGTATIACPTPSYGGACSAYTTEATCTATSGCAWAATYCYESGSTTACDYDGVCESGESTGSCPNDCGSYSGDSCSSYITEATCSTGTGCTWAATYCYYSGTTTGGSASCTGQTNSSSCLAAGSQCRWYQLIDGSAYCDDEPHTPSQTSCDNSGTCDASETADFCPLDCSTADAVSLSSVAIAGDQVTVTYSKNFATCAHLLTSGSVITHTNNFYCTEGNNISITQPLSAFTSVASGAQLKLCHGNNYNTCSSLATVTESAVQCNYNGTCDSGESYSTCPNDCSAPTNPVISNVQVSDITTNSATIGWTTDRPTTSKVEYWITTITGDFVEDPSFKESHQIILTGLQSGTTYTYNVVSRDDNYYTGYTYSKTFKTLSAAEADTVAPSVVSFNSYTSSDLELHANANFSEPVDQATLTPSNVFMRFADDGTSVSQSSSNIYKYSSSVEYTDYVPPDFSIGYELVIKNIKDLVGNVMQGTYVSPVFYASEPTTPLGDCAANTTSAACYAQPGCVWYGTYCQGDDYGGACTGTTKSTCETESGCVWDTANSFCSSSYTPTSDNCPTGFHYHSESGGYCINDQEDYSGTCYNSAGTAVITCPSGGTYGGGCYTYTTQATCTTTSGCEWDSLSASCYDTYGPTSSCPAGWAWNETAFSCVKDGVTCSDYNACSACSDSGGYSSSSSYSWCSYDNNGCPTGCQTATTGGGGGCISFTTQDTCTVDAYGTSCYWYAGTGYGYCDMGPNSTYAGDEFSCPGFSYSRWDENDNRYCQLNSAKSCSTSYPGYLDPATYTAANCPKEQVVVTCPTGYYWFVPGDGTAGYCRASETSSDTTPPSVDFSRSHPLEGDSSFPFDGKIKVVFSEDIDQTSISSSTFKLLSSTREVVPGVFEKFNNGFSFRLNQKLTPGATYSWKIFAGIRDKIGNATTGDYSVKFTVTTGTVAQKGALKGTITDGTGKPVKGAFVQVNDLNYSIWRGGETNASGTYAILDLPAGSYLLSVYAPPDRSNLISPDEDSVIVESGKTLTKNLSFLATTKTISGTVKASDGTAITDARVSAWRRDGYGNAEAKVDSSGNFFLSVAGGSWEVSAWPDNYDTAGWVSSNERAIVQFANDSTVETKKVSITVLRQNAKIKGKIINPDGSAPKPYDVSVSIDSFNRGGYPAQLSAAGTFSVAVVAGSYEVRVWPSNPDLKVSPISAVVKEGETKDLGVITLKKPEEKITGVVTDETGTPVAGLEINAWQDRGGSSARGKTDVQGAFSLSVTPGFWRVAVESHSSSQYASIDPPKEVEVKSRGTSRVSLSVVTVDSFIAGTVQDATGAVVKDFYGYIYVESFGFGLSGYDYGGGGFGGSVDRGSFQFRVPAGTHTIVLETPPGSEWGSAGSRSVTVVRGETIKTNFTLKKKGSEISGLIVDGSGVAVTGRSMRVFASGENGGWQEGFVDSATGKYTLKVSAGTWFINVDAGGYYGYGGYDVTNAVYQPGADVKVIVGEGEKISQNIALRKSDSTVSGTVTRANGTPLPYVWVSIDSESFSTFEKEFSAVDLYGGYHQSFGAETDAEGKFSVTIPAGTYFVHAFVPGRERLINPEEQKIVVAAGETAEVDLVARSTDIVLSGTVFREGEESNGFVSGWSEKGGYVETLASSDGSYSVNIAGGDIWHFYAARNFEGEWYRSSEATIEIGTESVLTQDFVMIRERSLSPPVTTTVEANKASVIKTDDGTKVALPAQSAGTSGNVSVSVEPDPEVPQQGNAKVVGVGYDVRVHDEVGKEVKELNSTITITIPYTDEDLVKQGITPQELKVAFWDENAGVWRELTASVVNEDEKTVTAVVDHLTRFAIVAAADIVPPEPPVDVAIAAPGAGKIDISWTKPAKDFSHVKIYRSSTMDELGKVRFAEVFENKVTDTGVTDGLTYYYTIRSVDPAGNESGNKVQVSVIAVGTSIASEKPVLLVGEKKEAPKRVRPTTPTISAPVAVSGVTFSRSLTVGMTGSDVTALQQILVAEGVYPEAITSGYFGALTKAAVIRFQDKYASEVLVPAGLTSGTGYVGPSTIRKLNALSGGGVSAPAPTPSVSVTLSGGALTRNLVVGMSGDDVATLQQLLVDEGVYPEAIVSGYFGALTKAAVIRFQDKYAAEVLAPVNLSSGTGYVGASTRAKANELLGK